MDRITIDLTKASTETVDLTNKLNPRVGDGNIKVPFHIVYGNSDYDMRGKNINFVSEGTDQKKINVLNAMDESSAGDDPYIGNVTFTFPTGTFKTAGTYDVDKTMFQIVDSESNVISSVNVKLNVLPNDSDPSSSDDISYDTRMENVVKDFTAKGQSSLDDAKKQSQQIIDDAKQEATDYLNDAKQKADAFLDDIKQISNEAKGNVSGDTATTATQAKQLANDNSGKIYDMQGEIGDARGRFMTLAHRENNQDANIDRKEEKANANANYAAIALRDDNQDREIATKASQHFIIDYLAKMHQLPIGFKNADAIKAQYPTGKEGVMLAGDTGHMYLWFNNQWNDCGQYQAAALTKETDEKLNSMPIRNLMRDPEFMNNDEWTTFGTATISAGRVYKGHKSLKVSRNGSSNVTEGAGVYSSPIAVTPGDKLSFSMLKAFFPASDNANGQAELFFYLNETDAYGQVADYKAITLALNPANITDWETVSQNDIEVPKNVNYVRVSLKFNGVGDTSYFEFTEPLLVNNDRIGSYSLDDVPNMIDEKSGNLFIDPDFETPSTLTGNGVSIDTSDYVDQHKLAVLDATNSTAEQPYVATKPLALHKASFLSFYCDYAYAKPTDGKPLTLSMELYNEYPNGTTVEPAETITKDFQPINTSYWHLSWDKNSINANYKYVILKFVLPVGSKMWLYNPILRANISTPIDVNDLALVKPKSITFIDPEYSIGQGNEGNVRRYLWIKFSKVIIDYYTEQREIDWKDWIGTSATIYADDFLEDVYYVDVGPQSSNPSQNHFDYNAENDHLEVEAFDNAYGIRLISYDPEKGFYGPFIDQANKDALTKRLGRDLYYNHLTWDMKKQIADKEQDVVNHFTNNDFVFGIITDDHRAQNHNSDTTTTQDPYSYSQLAYAKVSHDLSLDANWCIGDTVLSSKNTVRSLMSAFDEIPAKDWVYCEGNHDRNVGHGTVPILSKQAYNNIVNRVHRFDSNFHYGDSGSYFYVDYPHQKVRTIVLDDYDISDKHDADYNDNAGFRQNQLEWLANTALAVEDGWQVIVLVHQPPAPDFPENNRAINSDQLMQVMEAFVSGKNAHITARDTTYNDGTFDIDFTTNFTKPGTLIAVMSGHNHVDYQAKINGVNYVSTACGYIDVLLYHSQNGNPPKYGQRSNYDYSAICFDVAILNTKTHTLLLKRFGYGKDREIDY